MMPRRFGFGKQTALFKALSNNSEPEIPKQTPQPLFALFDIRIVTKLRQPACSDARMLRIGFPQVQIEDDRSKIAPVN